MRKLVIFLYFVFLFKIAFAQSLSLPKFRNIEPSAGQSVSQNDQVPALEQNTGDALPSDFDLPISANAKTPDSSDNKSAEVENKEIPPSDTSNTNTATIKIPDEVSVPNENGPAVTPETPEVSELPTLPDQPIQAADKAPVAKVAKTDAAKTTNTNDSKTSANELPNINLDDPTINKAMSDDSVRNQFPATPTLDYKDKKITKQNTEKLPAEVNNKDREKEVDSLLDQVFDKEKSADDIKKEKAEKEKDEKLAEKAKNVKPVDDLKIENVVDVSDTPVAAIDDLKTDDNEQADLADLPDSMKKKDGKKSNDFSQIQNKAPSKPVGFSNTYSEQQLADLLVKSAMNGDRNNVLELLNSGRNINSRNIYGESALMGAIYNNHNDIAEILLSEGADSNIADLKGNTPLHVAAAKNNVSAAQLLIRNNAQVDIANSSSDTPLLVATLNNNADVVDLLVRQHAYINKPNADGLTALHIAAYNGNVALTKYLLTAGANPNLIARGGLKPYDLAKDKNPEVANLLSSYSAPANQQVVQNTVAVTDSFKPRSVAPAPVVQGNIVNANKYAVYPKAYIAQENQAAEQLPQNDWWAAKPIAESTPDNNANQTMQSNQNSMNNSNQTMAPNNNGLKKVDYSSYYTSSAQPATSTENASDSKKWTKLTTDPNALKAPQVASIQPQLVKANNVPQSIQQVAPAKISVPAQMTFAPLAPVQQAPVQQAAAASQPVQNISTQQAPAIAQKANYNYLNPLQQAQQPGKAIAPIQNKMTAAAVAPVQQLPTPSNLADNSTMSEKLPMKVRYDANGNIVKTIAPNTAVNNNITRNIAPAITAPIAAQQNNNFTIPASLNKPAVNVAANNNSVINPNSTAKDILPIVEAWKKSTAAAAAKQSVQQIQPQQKISPQPQPQQPQFYNQPISNNINLNIPRYADLDSSKQAVWDKKLEEWVVNGININAKNDAQKMFWVKQQAVLEKVYQNQFITKVQQIKRKIGSSAMNVNPVVKKYTGITITSRPVKLGEIAPSAGSGTTTAPAPVKSGFKTSQIDNARALSELALLTN